MNNQEYIKLATRTESTLNPDRILHAALGLATEAGELLDAKKREMFYNKPLDWHNLIEEAGDIFWYLAILCDAMNVSFEEVQRRNIDKLRARYPEKFDTSLAINRNLEKERLALENESTS
jgi:NTP pyrophosphatase (non-canonical NTP hydrolase)